jgi:hypothetical protein
MPKEQNRRLIYIVGTNHYIKEYIIINRSRAIIPDEECLSCVLDLTAIYPEIMELVHAYFSC